MARASVRPARLSALLVAIAALAQFPLSAASFTHSTLSDFAGSSATWSGFGSSVTSSGVQLAYGGGELLSVETSTPLPTQQSNATIAIWNGRVYVVGANPSATTVRSASINDDGTMSTWRTETSLGATMRDGALATWNSRIYLAGGYRDGSGCLSEVWSSPINSDGTLGTWVTETALPVTRNGVRLEAWNGRLYQAGGSNTCNTANSAVYSVAIKSDGRLDSSWRTETALPTAMTWHALSVYNGRLYAGDSSAYYSSVINADGTLGAWATYTAPPASVNHTAAWNGRIYGGGNGDYLIYSTSISANGTIGNWIKENVAVPIVYSRNLAIWNGIMVLPGWGAGKEVYTMTLNVAGSAGGSWTTNGTNYPKTTSYQDTVAWKNRLYSIGGTFGGVAVSSVMTSVINSDRSIGSWSGIGPNSLGTTSSEGSVVINGWIYTFLGPPGNSPGTFEYAQLCSTGTLCSGWTQGAWPWGGAYHDAFTVVASSRSIYVLGGEEYSCGNVTVGYYATTCSTGTMCSGWTSYNVSGLPGILWKQGGAAHNGYLYTFGGQTTGCPGGCVPQTASVYFAALNSNNTVGNWTATTALPVTLRDMHVEVWDGSVYVMGGLDCNGAVLTSVYRAPINSNGTLGTWSTMSPLPAGRSVSNSQGSVKWQGKLYIVGGNASDTIFYSGVSSYTLAGSFFNMFDLGSDQTLDNVSWTAALNGGTLGVFISTASSSSTFSPWAQATSGATLSAPSVRYVRYRVDMAPSSANATPALSAITVNTSATQPSILVSTLSWTQLATSGTPPGGRDINSTVYDSVNDRMIIFGGRVACVQQNDVWVLSNTKGIGGTPTWTQLSPTGTPPVARVLHDAVYDQVNNRMIMFGGEASNECTTNAPMRNDTWVLTNANGLGGTPAWIELAPTGGPPGGRGASSMVYDQTNNRVIVFGGNPSSGYCFGNYSDTWVLTNANGLGGTPTWTQLSPPSAPGGRTNHRAIYDPASNRMTIHSGSIPCSTVYTDTWVLANANGLGGAPAWSQLSPTGTSPGARGFASQTYDTATNEMLLFAGAGTDTAVYVLTSANGLGGTPNWAQLATTGTAIPYRNNAPGVYDQATRRLIYFGGSTVSGFTNETWVLGAPTLSPAPFSNVAVSSLTANWTSPFPGGTLYYAQASTASNFTGAVLSSNTLNLFATFTGLNANTTYFTQVSTVSGGPFTSLGSTVTRVESPTAVVFDEVGPNFITASAYAPTPAFSNLERGLSGINVARDGTYAGFRTGNVWTTKTVMPTARYGHAAATVGGKIYAVGGVAGGRNQNEEYDPATNTWATNAVMPTARSQPAAATVGGKIYAVGGFDVVELNKNEEYDPAANSWAAKAAMPSPRQVLAAAAVGGRIYAIGGAGSDQNVNEEYDPATDAWATKAVMPTARYQLAAATVGGKIYAVGGNDAGGYSNKNEQYDPATNTWATKAVLPTARQAPAAAAVGGKIYAVGGYTSGAGYFNKNEEYDPAADTWATKAVMPTARQYLAAAAVGGKIYAVGGYSPSLLNTNEEYDPGVSTRFASLTPNTLYAFKAKARNAVGVETAESPIVSTYTAAARPGAPIGVATFTVVAVSSLTVNWSSGTVAEGFNPAGTQYVAQLSTMTTFASLAASSQTVAINAAFAGLAANTVYYARVRAVNAAGITTDFTGLGSVTTQATLDSAPFSNVTVSSLEANWSSTFSGGTLYYARASTASNFTGTVFSSNTLNLSATFTGLNANTTYFARVSTASGGPFTSLGSTGTRIESPTAVVFDEVSTGTITASAYADTPGFSNLDAGQSGINVTTGTLYGSWHSPGNRWTAKTAMLTARSSPAAAAVGGKIYVVGGWAGGASAVNEEYDPVTNGWATKAAMPTARDYPAAAAAGGKVYALGGYSASNAYLAANEAYDPVTNSWAVMQPLPTARRELAAAVVGGKIYALGGYSAGGDDLANNEEYDPLGNTWALKAALPTARSSLAAATVGGKIYALGGWLGGALAANAAYDPASDSWTTRAAMPTARYFPAAAAVGGKVHVLGGISTSIAYLTVNEAYDPVANSWAARTAMPTARGLLAAAAVGGKIYALAGYSAGGSDLAANEEYDPGVGQRFSGLTPNTSYSFKARARDAGGSETADSPTVSTYTLAAVAGPASGPTFTVVPNAGVIVNWSSGTAAGGFNAPGASYLVQASSMSDFIPVAFSSQTANLSAQLTGLTDNATYHFRVRAANSAGVSGDFLVLGTTVALGVEAPTGIVFDEISTGAITASAYAAAPGFSNLDAGQSGINVAKDGVYAGYRTGNVWTSRSAMTTNRRALAAAALGGKIYALGGYNGNNTGANEEYDPVTNAWASRASMPTPRNGLAAAAVAGKVYAMGGQTYPGNVFLNANEEYDPLSNSWTAKAAMPTARSYLPATALGGRIYVFGGNGGSRNENEEYDPATNTWAAKAVIPTPRAYAFAEAVGGKVYVVGGYAGAGSLSVNEAYDPATDTWATKASMPTARQQGGSASAGGKIFVLGGAVSPPGAVVGVNEEYDPSADAWTSRSAMTTAHHTLAAAAVGGRVYALGGTPDNVTDYAINEEYDPGVGQRFAGLTPNTSYSFKAKARDALGVETAESPAVSTYTLAAASGPLAGPAITASSTGSLTVSWSSGTPAGGFNAPGASYLVQASSMSAFMPVASSSQTASLSAQLTGLTSNATHHLRVKAANTAGVFGDFVSLGTAVTMADAAGVLPANTLPGAWTNSDRFPFSGVFGVGAAASYRTAWDQNAGHSFTGAETQWQSGNSTETATAEGAWHFHVAGVNWNGQLGPSRDIGPFLYDASSPSAASGFISLDRDGQAVQESQWNHLMTGVTAQVTVQDARSGFASDSFSAQVSTNAGASWTLITSTVPAVRPYLAWTGAVGATSPETLSVYGLNLAPSTTSATGAGGTNQLRFSLRDRAGNTRAGAGCTQREIRNYGFEEGSAGSCPPGWTCTGAAQTYDVGSPTTGCNFGGGGGNLSLAAEGTKYGLVGCDSTTGMMKSETFTLPPGADHLSFSMTGGAPAPSGVAVKRAADDATLCFSAQVTQTNDWLPGTCGGLSAYAGQAVYVHALDATSGGWGKVYVDNFRLQDSGNNNLLALFQESAGACAEGPFTVLVGNTLSVLGESAMPAIAYRGQEVPALKLTLSVDQGWAEFDRLQVSRTGLSTDADISKVRVWRDADGSGTFGAAGDALLGEGSLAAGAALVGVSTQTITAGTPRVYFVTYQVSPSANPSDTAGARINSPAQVSVLGPGTTVQGNFPMDSALGTIEPPVNILYALGQDAVLGDPNQGARDFGVLKLRLWTDANSVLLKQLRLTRTGTSADSDVAAIRLYRSPDTALFDRAASTPVTSGLDAFSNGEGTLVLDPQQEITPSTQSYFVAVDLASLAQPGATFGIRIASAPSPFIVSEPNVVSTATLPMASSLATVLQSPNTVVVSTGNLAPTAADPGQSGVPIMRFGLKTDKSNAIFSRMTIERSGTVTDPEIKAVKVFFDADGSGGLSGADTLVSPATGAFAGGTAALNLVPQTLSPAEKTYFVSVDFSTSAVPYRTMALKWLDRTFFTVDPPNAVSATTADGGNFPFQSALVTVRKPAVSVLVSASSLAPASAAQGAFNVPVLKLQLAASAYSAAWTRLTLTRAGSGADANVENIQLYHDTNGSGGLDLDGTDIRVTLGASNVFAGGIASLNLATQTITASTQTYFLVVNVSEVAAVGTTCGLSALTPGAFVLAAPDAAASVNFPLRSALFAVSATQTGLTVSGQNISPGTLEQGATAQAMLALTFNTTQHSVILSSIRIEREGTAADSDVANIRVFADADSDGAFGSSDPAITGSARRFVQGTVLVDFTPQTIGTTPKKIFVALDLADLAEADRTVGLLLASATSFTVNSPNFVVGSGLPIRTQPLVGISKRPRALRFSGANLAASRVFQGAVDSPFLRLDLSVSGDRALWSSLKINRVGSLSDSSILSVKLYKDNDSDGEVDPGSDVLVASGAFSNGSVQFSDLAQGVLPATSSYLATLTLALDAVPDQSLGLVVGEASFVGVDSPDSVLPFPSLESVLASVRDVRVPVTPQVHPEGARYSRYLTQLRFNWQSRMVTGAGSITGAQYAIGASPGATGIRDWTVLDPPTTQVAAAGLSLVNGATYYIAVRALSSFGYWSDAGVSDGIVVDVVVPAITGEVAASVNADAVLINWPSAVAGPSGIQGYLLEYRKGDSPIWYNAKTGALTTQAIAPAEREAVGETPGVRVLAIPFSQLFTGNSAVLTNQPKTTLFYRIQGVNGAGVVTRQAIFSPRFVFGELPAESISAASNYPNPFDSRKGHTTLHYILNQDAAVEIQVFDLYGGKVKEWSFPSGSSGGWAGSNEVVWDGKAGGGGKVSKGVYLAVIRALGAKTLLKIAVIH